MSQRSRLKSVVTFGDRLMLKLNYRSKFSLIAVAFLIPILVVFYFFIKEVNNGIDFARNENDGVRYLIPAFETLNKTTLAQAKNSAANLSLENLQKAESEVGASLTTEKDFQAVTKAINENNVAPLTEGAKKSSDAIVGLIGTIGNNSQLVLDPDIDSYYSMDTCVVQVVNLIQKTAAARDLAQKVIDQGSITAAERTDLTVLQGQVSAPLDTIKSDLKQAKDFNTSLSKDYTSAVEKLDSDFSKYLGVLRKVTESEKPTAELSDQLKTATASVYESMGELFKLTSSHLHELISVREEGYVSRRFGVSATVVISLLVAGYLFSALFRTSVKRLETLLNSALEVASGNISVEIPDLGKDEVGRLARDMNGLRQSLVQASEAAFEISKGNIHIDIPVRGEKDELGRSLQSMVATIRKVLQDVETNARQTIDSRSSLAGSVDRASEAMMSLSAAIEGIAAKSQDCALASSQIAESCREDANSSEEVASSMRSLISALSEVEKIIQQQQSTVQSATELSAIGRSTAADTLHNMRAIKSEVDHSAVEVEQLGRASGSISAIVSTIQDIADQTNLLALNAAIEAARAGEHGRGFAVVADEVRGLAQRSSLATKEIGTLLDDVAKRVNMSLESVLRTQTNVVDGSKTIEDAAEALNRIALNIEQIETGLDALHIGFDQMKGKSESVVSQLGTTVDQSRKTLLSADAAKQLVDEIVEHNAIAMQSVIHQAELIDDVHNVSSDLSAIADQLSDSVQFFQKDQFLRVA